MKREKTSLSYYLPRWRSMSIGIILVIVGLAFTFMGLLWNDLQWVLISFQGVVEFLASLLMLGFKIGFFLGGYFYIKYADGVERARLDSKGFYYREIPKGGRISKMAMDTGPLTFTPYQSIRDITLKKTFWAGWQLYLTLDSGIQPLTALGVLKRTEKEEILEKIKLNIQGSDVHRS